MSRRLLVNDCLNTMGEHTFWNDLVEWFGCEFVGSDYAGLAEVTESILGNLADNEKRPSLIIRNATWFLPIKTNVPTISLLQDIIPDGPMREMQEAVIKSSHAIVFNSPFTAHKYPLSGDACATEGMNRRIIPLPVDFQTFEPQNAMGCQQALSLPDGCVCWIGASQGAAGHIKGYDIFLQVVRLSPDIPFVAVFKDAMPTYAPPNLRCYARLTHADLVKVIGACRVGLCTSRTESQHLAGIEMGGAGLPLVVPDVGCYWKRRGMVGVIVEAPDVSRYTAAIRAFLSGGLPADADFIHSYWRTEFDKPVIKAQWTKLIEEVEGAA